LEAEEAEEEATLRSSPALPGEPAEEEEK